MTLSDRILSPQEEKQLAAPLAPGVAWPTILLGCATPAAFWTIIALGAAHAFPLWLCAAVLTPLSFIHYTIVHECVHGNMFPKAVHLRWLHEVFGRVGAIGLSQNYALLRRTHLLHHGHTNGTGDPDTFVKGSFPMLLLKWAGTAVLSVAPLWLVRGLRAELRTYLACLTPQEQFRTSVASTVYFLVFVAAFATGHGLEWTLLWFVPTRLALLVLNVFFQWLPHYPFDQTERYKDTRISLWPSAGLLLLQQNLHLVHHLWPAVPFYNYPALYRSLRAHLIAKGARIEGLLVGARARDLTAQERAKLKLEGSTQAQYEEPTGVTRSPS